MSGFFPFVTLSHQCHLFLADCCAFHCSEANSRGPTSIRRGIMLKTATRVHGLPERVRKPFSFRSLTIEE